MSRGGVDKYDLRATGLERVLWQVALAAPSMRAAAFTTVLRGPLWQGPTILVDPRRLTDKPPPQTWGHPFPLLTPQPNRGF